MHHLIAVTLALFCAFWTTNALALEGDWELGGAPGAFIMPDRDIYGGGTELFARYFVLDGLSLNLGAGFYGAKQIDAKFALGLYTLRTGIFYSLDVLQWVPGVGLNISALFSENKTYKFQKDGHGMAVDFDLFIQYRGIRHLGIGLFFSYHLVFVDDDYMTAGLSITWNSGMF